MKSNNNLYENVQAIAEKLSGGIKKIALVTHRNPDGDAMGASLGLFNLLTGMGHQVTMITPNLYPAFLQWLPGNDRVIVFERKRKVVIARIREADIIISLDFNDISRVKEFEKAISDSNAFRVLIDHHPDPSLFSDITVSDTSVSSTAELVYEVIIALGYGSRINESVAMCLFVGIMTDTGCFSYNSGNPRTYEIVSNLLKYNFDKDEVYARIYDNFSADRMRLLGYSLNEKMEVFEQYRTAFISLSRDDLNKYNFESGDTEGFVNYPLSVKNIRFSALFIEKKDIVKISFRSKGSFAANIFAKRFFNGGGHLNAAGGESKASLAETTDRFVRLLKEYEKELGSYD